MPAKLAARVRLFDTGHNRKTDALDAHSIAVVAVRTEGLRVVVEDGELEALRMLTDRRDELARQRVQTVNRLQRLLSELLPGQRKRDLSATQAKAMLATIRPRDIAGKTRRRMAAEEIADLVAVDAKLKKIKAELKAAVLERGSELMDIYGVGPAGAARVLADVGDVARFADRNRFASWTGTAPLDASSGEQNRHRLVTCGEPADEPRPARRRDRADPSRHRRPRLLPTQARRRQDTDGSAAVPEATPVRCRLPPARRRRRTAIAGLERVREGTAGRLFNPARPTRTRSSTLRISHFPDPRSRRYADHQPPEDPHSKPLLDTEGCQIRTFVVRPSVPFPIGGRSSEDVVPVGEVAKGAWLIQHELSDVLCSRLHVPPADAGHVLPLAWRHVYLNHLSGAVFSDEHDG